MRDGQDATGRRSSQQGNLQPTPWRAVAVVVAAGAVSAYHLGKVSIAGPQLQSDLGLSLEMLGALGATFALLGALGGMLAGSWVARAGDRRMLLGAWRRHCSAPRSRWPSRRPALPRCWHRA